MVWKRGILEYMRKRTWCYAQKPIIYEITCDLCQGTNTTWSEYIDHIWCYDCEKDTKGTEGIFGGPIGIGVCNLLGIRFDRINLKTRKIMKQKRWVKRKEK